MSDLNGRAPRGTNVKQKVVMGMLKLYENKKTFFSCWFLKPFFLAFQFLKVIANNFGATIFLIFKNIGLPIFVTYSWRPRVAKSWLRPCSRHRQNVSGTV
jgi:hypothetical protein